VEIRTKAEFYRLWEAGCLGNKLRTWRDPAEAYRSGAPVVGFREIGKAGGGKLQIVCREAIVPTAHDWRMDGRAYMICEAAPDERGTIQGEVMRGVGGWRGTLGLSTGLRMREAAARGLLVPRAGAAVVALMDRYMDPSSRDDVEDLLELYPDAVVEFTCYECMVGSLPGRNTIIWEVRNY
jgi:hypothetical protein